MDRWIVFKTLKSDSIELFVNSLTSSMSPTNVINIQIRLLVEDNQQLRDKITKHVGDERYKKGLKGNAKVRVI